MVAADWGRMMFDIIEREREGNSAAHMGRIVVESRSQKLYFSMKGAISTYFRKVKS